MLTISFVLDGDFAAFKDPSITTSQVVYSIPSKSAVVGIVGSILGVKRSHKLDQLYSDDFLDLMKKLQIGIELLSEPKKITYYTNHRSLKESKTKPFKKEVIESPSYRIYISSNEDKIINETFDRIKHKNFEYLPYLGHAYCPARIYSVHFYDNSMEDTKSDKGIEFETSSVVLDESENYDNHFEISKIEPTEYDSSILVERHLHHFYINEDLNIRVLKFWIPVRVAYSFYLSKKPGLFKIVKLNKDDGMNVCLY